MKKMLLATLLLTFGYSNAENIVLDIGELENKLNKLSDMHAKECSPVEYAYAETYLESLKSGKGYSKADGKDEYIVESKFKECGPLEIGYVKTCLESYKVAKKEEKKGIVVRNNSVDAVSYPVKISYYLALIEKNIYSDKDGDGIPCYKEIELGLNPDVYDSPKQTEEKIREEKVVLTEQVVETKPTQTATVKEEIDPLNQPVRVHFYFNRADIKKEYLPYLNVVAKFMKTHPSVKVKITGYTDNIGSKSYNDKLAMKRAMSVKNYLVKNGVEPSRIVIEGVGKDRYLVANDNGLDRFTNRRAEFYVIKLAD